MESETAAGAILRDKILLLLIFASILYPFQLSPSCVYQLIGHAIKGLLNDFVSSYDIFRVHWTKVCGLEVTYSFNGIDINDNKLFFIFDLGVIDHNKYVLECSVLEKGKYWDYICDLKVKPKFSAEYDLLREYRGKLNSPIPIIESHKVTNAKPCKEYKDLYERLLEAKAFELFPLRSPHDPLLSFMITYTNNEFALLLQLMSKCDNDVNKLRKMLYFHIDELSRLGVIESNRAQLIEKALVPCWSFEQCTIREAWLHILNFYGFKTDELGRIKVVNLTDLVLKGLITILILTFLSKRLVKFIVRIKINRALKSFNH